ncbi:MAG: hypothetical protein ACRDZ4_10705, partial [Egibacteraceae bacterium]
GQGLGESPIDGHRNRASLRPQGKAAILKHVLRRPRLQHWLSTIRSVDLIVVRDDGRVAQAGAYEQLIATDGVFARLVAAQRMGRLQRGRSPQSSPLPPWP